MMDKAIIGTRPSRIMNFLNSVTLNGCTGHAFRHLLATFFADREVYSHWKDIVAFVRILRNVES